MSSSRSITAARQRRGVESAPPMKNNNYVSNSVGKDNFNNNQQSRPNYRTTKNNTYQDANSNNSNSNSSANPVSKLSVSDAFALVTLRLGRVELIINKLQTEGIIDANNNVINEKLNATGGNNNFDDTILQNIITRLDGLDKKTVSNDLNQKLQSQYNSLSEDVKQTKEVVMKLQSFIMDVSQKMNSFITTQENINEDFFDLRDDFHNSLVNDTANPLEQLENGPIEESDINDVDANNESTEIATENQLNDVVSHENQSDDKNIDSLIANNLNNFTEEANDNDTNNTTSISKNKQKNNKNKSMNLNV
jgi:hypothetical protein